jgi:Na+(H+)/acetate symporter ActP
MYSLVLATFLGTMGLPHVLVRFYTNVDGPAARRTTVTVLGLLGVFYLFPGLGGLLAHRYEGVPPIGGSDSALLRLPAAALSGTPAVVLGALVAAGAIAAFLSTSSGLVVAAAGVLSTDVLPGRVRDFRVAAVVAGLVPIGLALATTTLDISQVVGMAFAVAASTFCPLLVLGIWWRGLTVAGAAAGLVVGGGLSLLAVAGAVLTRADPPPIGWLLAQPAAFTVPVSFLTMVVVSLLTRRRISPGVDAVLARFHLPVNARLASRQRA